MFIKNQISLEYLVKIFNMYNTIFKKFNIFKKFILIIYLYCINCLPAIAQTTENNLYNNIPVFNQNANKYYPTLSSQRQLGVSQGYGEPEYRKFNWAPTENTNFSVNRTKTAQNQISRDSKLAAVRQLRLSQRYGDPEYTKFNSSSITRFYGFIGYELVFFTRQVIEDFAIGEYLYPNLFLPDYNNKDINAHGRTIMDAASSRLGIFFNPFQNDGLDNIYGIIEFDFRGTIQINQYTAKIRHSFGELAWKNGSFLFGQYYHPLFLAESFPRVVSYNMGSPFETKCICPQIRVTQQWGPWEFMFSLISQSYLETYGPIGPSASLIQNAIVPNINFGFKWRIHDSFYGFSFDYLRIVPRLLSAVDINEHQTITFKVDEQLNSVNAEIFAHNVFSRGEINAKLVFTQNGSNQLLISGYGIKTVANFTGYQTYAPTNAISFWLDAFYLFHNNKMHFGVFLGYTQNLGSFTDLYIYPDRAQPIVFSLAENAYGIAYLYRISSRYVYDIGSFRFGIELQWDMIAYGFTDSINPDQPMINERAIPLYPVPVNCFSPIIVLEYPF